MEHEKCSVEKFTWKIENFSGVMAESIPSERFVLGSYPWGILVYPKGNKRNDSLSIYLEVAQFNEISERWNRDVKFNLLVLNQLNTNKTISKASDGRFNPSQKSCGFQSFMSLAELHDPNNGFIVNDVCIVGVEVCVCKSRYEKPVDEIENMEVEVPRPNPEVQGFEKDSTKDPDAELVCSALGRVIYFLKTRKVKDMNEQGCKELQVLWNELEKFKIDLTWLEPQVQYALGMKSYVETAIQEEKLKENVAAQELETKRLKKSFAEKTMELEKLKENVAVQELETERLKSDMIKAMANHYKAFDLLRAKGLKDVDLDFELGCGSWRPKIYR